MHVEVTGYNVRIILMDMKFVKFMDEVPLVDINPTLARERVGEIERQIRVVKE